MIGAILAIFWHHYFKAAKLIGMKCKNGY